MIYTLSKGEETFLDVCKATLGFLFLCGLVFITPALLLIYLIGDASHGHLS